MAEKTRRTKSSSGGFLSHRKLVAIEALLLAAWGKSQLTDAILASGMENWVKVLVVMGMTVGLFGGVLLFFESLTKSGVQHGHSFVKGFTGSGSALLVHSVVFVLLFVLYAHMLRVSVF
ncbi:MAG: hypothetical protein ACKO32_08615 [Planctomycetia bacterium]